jgi:hypothetical protein
MYRLLSSPRKAEIDVMAENVCLFEAIEIDIDMSV